VFKKSAKNPAIKVHFRLLKVNSALLSLVAAPSPLPVKIEVNCMQAIDINNLTILNSPQKARVSIAKKS
jgi:hypothetical protein